MNKTTIGKINFFSHTTDGSFPYMDVTPKLGWTLSNYVLIPTPVTICDLRGKENTVNLDNNGFELLNYHGHIHNIYDDRSETQQHYQEEIANLLKKHLGASRVIIYNHIMRARGPSRPADQCDASHKNPVYYAHVDNIPLEVGKKVKELLGEEEGETVMQKRYQIINVWRPLGPNLITNIPLAICDYRSFDPDIDLHISEIRGTAATGSLYILSNHSQRQQKWYYWNNMRSNEIILLKIFDSNPHVAQYGAHTAFIDENVSPSDVEQHSIEMRCLILYD